MQDYSFVAQGLYDILYGLDLSYVVMSCMFIVEQVMYNYNRLSYVCKSLKTLVQLCKLVCTSHLSIFRYPDIFAKHYYHFK